MNVEELALEDGDAIVLRDENDISDDEFERDHDFGSLAQFVPVNDIGNGASESKSSSKKCVGLSSYWDMIENVLSIRFVIFLLFSQLLGKGMLFRIVQGLLLPIFKSLSVDGATLQMYSVAIMMPWAVKPLMGLASDLVLLGGYHKKYWLVLSCLLGTGCAGLAFISYYVWHSTLGLLFGLCGVNVQIAFYDLLSEGKYSELRNDNPHIGSDATTLVQGMNMTGALIAMSFVGIVADQGRFWILFLLSVLLAFSPLGPTLLGWLPEYRLVNARLIQLVGAERLERERNIIAVVAFCGVGSVVVSLLASLVTPIGGLVTAVLFLAASLVGCYHAFPPGIFQVALYQVLSILAHPSLGGALSYFYTADAVCLPNGPHFSYSYYITYTGLVGTVISFVGVWLYQFTLSRLRFRPVLVLTTVLAVFGGLADLVITMRWNVAWGISDKTAYMVGEAILEPLLGMLNWIPASALIAMAVPKGMESSCFAFMAGISNFSGMVAQISGTVLYKAAGVVTTLDPVCNFEALPWLVLLCHVCLPLMIAVPAVWLVPNLRQTDSMM